MAFRFISGQNIGLLALKPFVEIVLINFLSSSIPSCDLKKSKDSGNIVPPTVDEGPTSPNFPSLFHQSSLNIPRNIWRKLQDITGIDSFIILSPMS